MGLYDSAPTNDWQDVVFGRTGHTFNHNLNISGGSDKTKFTFGYAYMDDKAIMIGSNFRRDNLSLKFNHKPSKKVTLDFSVRYSNTKVRGAGANESKNEVSSADSRMKNVMIYTPFNFVDLSDSYDADFQLTNPVVSVYDNDRKQQRQTFDMNGSFTWEIFKNFKFKTELGLQHYYNEDLRFYGVTTYNARENGGGKPMSQFEDQRRKTVRNTNTINYDFKEIFGKNSPHKLNVLLGQETITKKSNVNTDLMYNYPSDFNSQKAWAMSSQAQAKSVNKYYNADDNLVSFFARANYDYMGKYLLSATFRADGSSKFADGKRWGYFPSVALAWRVSDEKFMDFSKNWLDDLKFRVSFGTAGNNNIPVGQNSRIWQAGTGNSLQWMTGINSFWTTGSHMANPDLTWETTITRNIGLDFTLFDGKINGSLEAYLNTTKDLLIDYRMSGAFTSQYRNLGETQNKGLEFSFTYHIVNQKNWGIDFTGNLGINKSKIKSLGDGFNPYTTSGCLGSTEIPNDYVLQVGSAVGLINGYVSDGRYEVSDFKGYDEATKQWVLNDGVVDGTNFLGHSVRPGDMKVKDLDGDNIIKTDGGDCQVIGDTNPDMTGGFALSARAYGFDFGMQLSFQLGGKVYDATYQALMHTQNNIGSAWHKDAMDAWSYDNKGSDIPRLDGDTQVGQTSVDRFLVSSDYLSFNNVQLGYTFPKKLITPLTLSALRVYVSVENLAVISARKGLDPRFSMGVGGYSSGMGMTTSSYSAMRTITAGLTVSF